eukprot:g1080.t1
MYYALQHHLVGAAGPIVSDQDHRGGADAKDLIGAAFKQRQAALAEAQQRTQLPPSLLSLHQTSNTPYSLRGASALALALRTNDTLRSLSLVGTGLGAAAVVVLAEALAQNHALRFVKLDTVAPLDVRALNGSLGQAAAHIDLAGKGVGAASLAFITFFLGEVNRTTTSLSLADNAIKADGADALARVLVRNKVLTALDLRENRLGEDGASALAKALQRNRTLQRLDLEHNAIKNGGGLHFAALLGMGACSLTHIALGHNELSLNTDEEDAVVKIAEAMRVNSKLTELKLGHNYIKGKGAVALCEYAIKKKRVLTSLDLAHNRLGLRGGRQLVEMLRQNGALRTLALAESGLEDEHLEKIRKICRDKGIKLDVGLEDGDDGGAEGDSEDEEDNGAGVIG